LKRQFFHKSYFFLVLVLLSFGAAAQYRVQGNVYDSSRTYPIQSVTILATNGKIAVTDSNGHYQVDVGEKDSIWFSFLGKPTPKYPVSKIADVNHFDLALRLKIDVMQEVVIRTRHYISDSLQNRRDYARVFNYERPNVSTMTSMGPMGAGIDVNELIRLFQFRKNKSMIRFRERLEAEEKEKFVDRRFNKVLVRSLTGLDENDLQDFMRSYRPTYEFTAGTSDYDFRFFIKLAAEQFKKAKVI
jgi:hypothetical protein